MGAAHIDGAMRALVAAERGDYREVPETLVRLDADGSAEARAWAAALRAAGSLAAPERFEAPSPSAIEALAGASDVARRGGARACAWMERRAAVRFDEAELALWVQVHGEIATDLGELEQAWLRSGRAWLALCGDDLADVPDEVASIEAVASRARDASLVVDSASLRALALVLTDRLEDATSVARRASRMGRTESLPAQEYLAHLVLARVRRLHGKAAMATRILSALAQVAPRPWWGWIAWEQLLAAGPDLASPLIDSLSPGDGPVHAAAIGLHRVLSRARDVDRAEMVRAFSALRGSAPGFARLPEELDAVRIALDPDADPGLAPPALAAWIRGEVDATAPGLPGLCIAAGEDSASNEPAAWVVADPKRRPRRVTRAGVGLAERAVRVDHTRMRVGREDTALAVLALAGTEGLSLEDCFHRVYGFAYLPELHEGTFRVLVHRLKSRLADAGSIHWGGGRIAIELTRPLIVADPRCSRATDDRVMLALARSGSATAKEIAAALRIPLRTVQSAIRELVDEGACRPEQEGRVVRYVVEDTTFSEPTRI